MADGVVDAARRQARRRRALFRHGAGAGLRGTAVSGRLLVVGLGPGEPRFLTHEAEAALAAAEAVYRLRSLSRPRCRVRAGPERAIRPTTARSWRGRRRRWRTPPRAQRRGRLRRRSRASSPWPRRSARRSRRGPDAWRALDVAVVPGVTAMLAVAARARRAARPRFLRDLAVRQSQAVGRSSSGGCGRGRAAGFVIALYNPVSRARPWQLGTAFDDACDASCRPTTPVIFGRAVGRRDERLAVATLGEGRRRDGRHGDAGHRRLGGDAGRRAARPRAARLYAALGGAGRDMIEPVDRARDGLDGRGLRQRRPPRP